MFCGHESDAVLEEQRNHLRDHLAPSLFCCSDPGAHHGDDVFSVQSEIPTLSVTT